MKSDNEIRNKLRDSTRSPLQNYDLYSSAIQESQRKIQEIRETRNNSLPRNEMRTTAETYKRRMSPLKSNPMHIVESPNKNTWMDDMRQSTAQRSMYDRYVAEAKENTERNSPWK
jgi:hypothetical protein